MRSARVWIACGPLLAFGSISLACTSTSASSPEADAGADGSPPPSLADAGTDGESFDAPAEAAPPKRLEVVCDGGPCYLSVNGNGGHHLCGLLQNGTVQCWGGDTQDDDLRGAALGRGVPASVLEGSTPAPVLDLSSATQVSVGSNFGTCARTSNGSVYCWGKNELGQLGRPPSEAHLYRPTRIEGLPPVQEVALGFAIGCAIDSESRALHCWGTDSSGVLTPPRVMTEFAPPIKALAIGSWNEGDTIVVLLEGDVLSSIGSNRPPAPFAHTGPVARSGVAWIAPFAYARTDGTPQRWIPEEETLYIPSLSPVVDAKLSGKDFQDEQGMTPWLPVQGAALTATGYLYQWGPNRAGALGVHPAVLRNARYPVPITQINGEIVSFATTLGSTCASLVSGKVKCWGANAFGELGRGSIDLDPHPEAEFIR